MEIFNAPSFWATLGFADRRLKILHYLDQFIGMFAEHLCILLHFLLISILGSFNQDQEGNICLQEGVRDMVHYSFAQL